MPLLYFVQYSQAVPFSLTQGDSLRFHGAPATHESGHFYFAQTGHSHFAATRLILPLTRGEYSVILVLRNERHTHSSGASPPPSSRPRAAPPEVCIAIR